MRDVLVDGRYAADDAPHEAVVDENAAGPARAAGSAHASRSTGESEDGKKVATLPAVVGITKSVSRGLQLDAVARLLPPRHGARHRVVHEHVRGPAPRRGRHPAARARRRPHRGPPDQHHEPRERGPGAPQLDRPRGAGPLAVRARGAARRGDARRRRRWPGRSPPAPATCRPGRRWAPSGRRRSPGSPSRPS